MYSLERMLAEYVGNSVVDVETAALKAQDIKLYEQYLEITMRKGNPT